MAQQHRSIDVKGDAKTSTAHTGNSSITYHMEYSVAISAADIEHGAASTPKRAASESTQLARDIGSML